MVNELFIFHHEKNQKNAKVAGGDLLNETSQRLPSVQFETCLRKIHLSKYIPESLMNNPSHKNWQVMEGENAYSFLLEILAGLHSPMVGETEVFGQFKNQMQTQKETVSLLSPWISWMYEDVKKVRSQCLQNLGSQTYGSWVRTLMPRKRPLVVLGAGQMCQKIYPYIQSQEQPVVIVTRSPEKSRDQYPTPIYSYEENLQAKLTGNKTFLEIDLIIAAPISNEHLRLWLEKNPVLIHNYLDLRGEEEPLEQIKNQGFKMGLKDFFRLQEQQKHALSSRVEDAKKFIHSISHTRFEVSFNRPWGWDDVCL